MPLSSSFCAVVSYVSSGMSPIPMVATGSSPASPSILFETSCTSSASDEVSIGLYQALWIKTVGRVPYSRLAKPEKSDTYYMYKNGVDLHWLIPVETCEAKRSTHEKGMAQK